MEISRISGLPLSPQAPNQLEEVRSIIQERQWMKRCLILGTIPMAQLIIIAKKPYSVLTETVEASHFFPGYGPHAT